MNDTCESLIFTAIGTASMCWKPRPGNQVFVSEEALEVGNQLISALDKELSKQADNTGSLKLIALADRAISQLEMMSLHQALDTIKELRNQLQASA